MNVDFYVLSQPKSKIAYLSICQIIEKKYLAGERIFIYTKNPNEIVEWDSLLWTYNDISFIPHCISDQNHDVPIQIGEKIYRQDFSLLLNLTTEIPAAHTGLKNINRR